MQGVLNLPFSYISSQTYLRTTSKMPKTAKCNGTRSLNLDRHVYAANAHDFTTMIFAARELLCRCILAQVELGCDDSPTVSGWGLGPCFSTRVVDTAWAE